jgi:cysteine desulfurase/selenocysteine lyase
MPPPSTKPDWNAFRRQMPVAERYAYFDHAAVAPLSAPAQAAVRAWLDDSAQCGDLHWLDWAARLEQTRQSAARLVGADPDEIALAPNTTAGINWVAEGLDWRPGDNVVLPADEFPSNQYPWLNLASRGVEARRVEPVDGHVSLEALLAACDDRTRVVAVSWVGYAHGWRHDLDALVDAIHRRGPLVFLDAIQGLGVFPLDVTRTPVDFWAADGHKWLLGPEGAGLFYARRERLDQLRPVGVGWNSVVQGGDFSRIDPRWKPSAARYEGGTYNMGGLVGLGASLDLLLEYGPVAIGERLLSITAEARERLRQAGATVHGPDDDASRSGIVAFDWRDEPPTVVRRRCLERGVVLSCRAGRIRISPHAYTDSSDLDRLLAALVTPD